MLDRLVSIASANTALPHKWVGKCWLRDLRGSRSRLWWFWFALAAQSGLGCVRFVR